MSISAEKIGFIGLGKLGMPCAEAIASKGFKVLGYDIQSKHSDKIEIVNSIESKLTSNSMTFPANDLLFFEKIFSLFIEREKTDSIDRFLPRL